jgi:hypothetical protein
VRLNNVDRLRGEAVKTSRRPRGRPVSVVPDSSGVPFLSFEASSQVADYTGFWKMGNKKAPLRVLLAMQLGGELA